MKILLAEDEQDLNLLIQKKLVSEGYRVDGVLDGQDAIDYISQYDYDAVILDVMMPKKDGFEVLSYIRSSGKSVPVIFLTARDSIEDKVRGLDAGANDYLVKPFSFEELLARIRVMTRAAAGQAENKLTAGDLELDLLTKRVTRAGEEIELSLKEFSLLEYLMSNKGRVLSREKIENHVWDYDYDGGTNIVDVYIRYLRKKIDDGNEVKLIHTVRGHGYTIRDS